MSVANAQLGALVESKDILFEIVEPARLWVEATLTDPSLAGQVNAATAVTTDGTQIAFTLDAELERHCPLAQRDAAADELYARHSFALLALLSMGNVPLALIGSVAALWIAVQPLSVATMVGSITFTGISARNGILKVSHHINLDFHEGWCAAASSG